jgi:hypothetical protein
MVDLGRRTELPQESFEMIGYHRWTLKWSNNDVGRSGE